MTPLANDAEVQLASNAEIRQAISRTLAEAGVSLVELKQQAAAGVFSSDRARRAWFTVAPVVRRG